MRYVAVVATGFVFLSGIAYADGFAQTLDKPVGDYIANVDYDSYSPEMSAQNSTSFSFQLWNKDRSKTVSYNDVSINIFQKDNPRRTVFSGTLSGSFGQAGMRITFQNEGAYIMDVRFHDANYATIAEASFPLEVAPDGETYGMNTLWLVIAGAFGFMIGAGLMLFRQIYPSTPNTASR
jgi:hypothetical protein